jgi:FeS assembly SUF system regulator
MLKIGKMTDYAILILSRMAKTPTLVLSANALAADVYLPQPTVSKILKILSDKCLVESMRGPDGGYKLAKAAAEISIVDVIAAMEGGIALTECCATSGQCAIDSRCTLRKNWQRINKMMGTMLASFTLLDMLTPL